MRGHLEALGATNNAGRIDEAKPRFMKRLAEAVAIPSVSADKEHRQDVFRMAEWVKGEFEKLGATMQLHENPLKKQTIEGEEVPLPPIVTGVYGSDPAKKTVLIYNHYDVQPALESDGWPGDPFTMVIDESNDRMIGRGATDDKGPLVAWINIIETYQKAGIDFPINLKMCFEGMEESGSEGLEEFIAQEAKGCLAGIDATTIVDNYWLVARKPVLTYGLRGISYFNIRISGPGADLHSGAFGGTVHEPMTDLSHIFASLVQPDGKITIPGIYDTVAKLTDEESALYDPIDFTLEDLESTAGGKVVIQDTPKAALMAHFRYPSLSIHGVEGAFYSGGAKTVIPASVSGKFSIRLVPDMKPDETFKLVSEHVRKVFAGLGSKNKLEIDDLHGGRPWVTSPTNGHYSAARKATEQVFGVSPDMIREGGSIPVTIAFEEQLGKGVLLLPMGRGDDGAHSTNEKLNISNYINGTKLYAAYAQNVAAASSLA